jgi:hypothetical protein
MLLKGQLYRSCLLQPAVRLGLQAEYSIGQTRSAAQLSDGRPHHVTVCVIIL